MSTTQTLVPPQAPFHQWQNFYVTPSAAPTFSGPAPSYLGYGQNEPTTLKDQIYAAVIGSAEQQKQQAANDIARDILRAVDHNGMQNLHSTERNSADIISAVDRNGSNNMSTTERVNSQLATSLERVGSNCNSTTERVGFQLGSAVERTGATSASTTERTSAQLASAIERNGANNLSAIERTTGEARLTTVVTDAASRQAANDSARDITKTIDNYGILNLGATKDSYNGLLGSIERNSGENRSQILNTNNNINSTLTDTRHSILNDINRSANEILLSNTQNLNQINKSVTDSAWESRQMFGLSFKELAEGNSSTKQDIMTALGNGFTTSWSEQVKMGQHLADKAELASAKASDHYSSLLLEQQKMGQFLSSKADNHFSMNTLELLKVKEGIMTQSAQQFAMTQLEMQKVKEGLAAQSAHQYATSQLEAQKVREHLSGQMADAKYEQLKSQQFLADKINECCCTVKDKMSTIDRDNLRDNLDVAREKNNMTDMLEYQQLYWGRPCGGPGPWGGAGPWGGPGPWGPWGDDYGDRRGGRGGRGGGRGGGGGDDHH